jgi:hypothetical protein
MDLTIGSFDDPAPFAPKWNFGVEGRLDAWRDSSHLPDYRADDHEPTQQRWKDAGATPAY